MSRLSSNTILVGDALEQVAALPTASIDCVVTSPPYYQLRDYGMAGQIGLEGHVDLWVAALLAVFHDLARVLKPGGAIWLNLGDTYSENDRYGAPPKGLLLAPERLLLALTRDGWRCRNKVVWAKPNPLPHSVRDRLNTTYELLYFVVRSRRYFFDLDLIREPHRSHPRRRPPYTETGAWRGPLAGTRTGLAGSRYSAVPGHPQGKNPGDVWQVPTTGYKSAHFATFPEAVIERPLLATCPEKVCTNCGAPWQRQRSRSTVDGGEAQVHRNAESLRYLKAATVLRQLGSNQPACACDAPAEPGVVLDPFIGTGTVAVVAERLGRRWLGIELNPDYVQLAWQRVRTARQSRSARDDQVPAA